MPGIQTFKESTDYKIAEVVFSRYQFNKEDVRNALSSKGVRLSLDEVTDILDNFRDKGLIAKVGSSYCVNP